MTVPISSTSSLFIATSFASTGGTLKSNSSTIGSPTEALGLKLRTAAPVKPAPDSHGSRTRSAQALQPKPVNTAAPVVADAFLSRIAQFTGEVRSLEERAKATAATAGTGPDPHARLRSAEQATGLLEFALGEVQQVQATLQDMAGQTLQGTGRVSESDRALANTAMQTIAATGSGLAEAPLLHPGGGTLNERVQGLVTASAWLNDEHKAIARLTAMGAHAPEIRLHVDAEWKALQAVGEAHGRLHALVEQVKTKTRTARSEVASLHDEQLRQITEQPPRFPDGPQKTALAQQLRGLARTLPRPTGPADLGRPAVLRMALEALSLVTGGDAARASAALEALSRRPLQDWVPLPGAAPEAIAGASADVRAMLYVMNHLPRGLEAAGLLGDHQGRPPSAGQLDAMGTYLSAEQARQAASPPVQAWLAGAMEVAQHKLHTGSAADSEPTARAAYAAVRSGLLSNEPGSRYQQLNQRVEQAFSAWITSGAQEHGHMPEWLSKWVPPKHPMQNLTPFDGTTLDEGAHAAVHTGLRTGATLADEQVRATAALLHPLLPTGNDARGLALRTVLTWLQNRSTADVAGRTLTDADINAMARRLINDTRESHSPQRGNSPPKLEQRARDLLAGVTEEIDDLHDAAVEKLQDGVDKLGIHAHVQPHDKELTRLVQPGDTPAQVLERVLAAVAPPDKDLAPIRAALQRAHQAEAAAGVHRIKNGDDLDLLLDPIVANLEQGDSLKLQGAADTGVSLPYVPLGAVGPVTLTLAGAYHHERDASLEIRRDASGILFSLGTADLHAVEAQVTAGGKLGPELAKVAVTVGVHHERSRRDAEALILRVPGTPGEDAALHQDARAVLRDLTAWHKQEAGTGHPDLLSFLLGRHDDLDLVDMSHSTRSSSSTEFSLTAGLMFPLPPRMRLRYLTGPQVGATFATSHQESQRRDSGGHERVEQSDSTTSAQRLTLHAGLSLPGLPGYTKDIYRTEDKKTLTATSIGTRLDAQLEHQSLAANQMLAELDAGREAWLARAVAHNGRDAGRELAGEQLDAFINTVKQVQAEAKAKPKDGVGQVTHHFVVNQTLNESARTALETLEGDGRLATLHGDTAWLGQIDADRKKLLDEASSWQPGALFVTRHIEEERDKGLPLGVIRQRKFQAEAQHVVAQFPPQAQAAA